MVAASRIVAVAQIIPSYSPGGADVYPIGYIVRLAYARLLPCQTTFRSFIRSCRTHCCVQRQTHGHTYHAKSRRL